MVGGGRAREVGPGTQVRLGEGGAFRGWLGTVRWIGRFGLYQERRAQVEFPNGNRVMVGVRRLVPVVQTWRTA